MNFNCWTVVLPAPRYDQRIWQAQVELYKQWRIEYDAAHPAPPITNIRFAHDPNWRSNAVLSVQAAHDQKHPLWQAVSFLTYLACLSLALATFFAATIGWRLGVIVR